MGKFIELAKRITGIDGTAEIVKWTVLSAENHVLKPSTYLLVRVQMYSDGEGDANPYGSVRTLCIRDGNALSSCLRVNVDGPGHDQHLEIYDNVIGGTPYTDLLALFAEQSEDVIGADGKRERDPVVMSKRLQRLQGGLVAAGAMSADFAGT